MTQSKGTELYDYQDHDLTSNPSSSNRIIIFAVFRNLWLIIMNWWTAMWDSISINPDGRTWWMVLCLPGDHIKNHIMQVQEKSTVMRLLRVIKINLNNLYSVIIMSSSSKNEYNLVRILFFVLLPTVKPIKRESYVKELICNEILTLHIGRVTVWSSSPCW